MNIIKILPEQEAQKIAAGEVVERPASIIKETIENSIDAQANQISLYIQKAGKELIRVVDNGCGMSSDDAKICFQPHATSKIKTINDLLSIQSFGFRGEALASISAVSKITLITKHKSSKNELGIKLKYESGNIISEEKVSCSIGTDLKIQDLFYNIPARKKFLKQDETEWNQILNIFYAFCLSNLQIHFKAYRDEKLFLNAPFVKNLKDRACQIWGHNFAQNLIELENSEHKDIKINGIISNHNFWRYGRQQIFFFVNNRAVKNIELSKALLKGYSNVLPPARFPAAFIFIKISNELVDINVHPRKEEVKFSKPVTIKNHLQKLVHQTLENNLNKKIGNKNFEDFVDIEQKSTFPNAANLKNIIPNFSQMPYENKTQNKFENLNQNKVNIASQIKVCSDFDEPSLTKKVVSAATTEKLRFINNIDQENSQLKIQNQNTPKIIGQLFKTYILLENDEELILIDQHAAHERILYEKFLKNFEKKDGTRLLFPQILELQNEQIKIILNEKKFFYSQGIELEHFGQNKIAIKTSPPKIQNHDLKELILEMIEFIQENEHLEKDVFRKKLNEHMHAQMSCKMAIKAGDVLNQIIMQNVIDDLQKTNNRLTCPHGRPTTWIIRKYDIERNFKRK